MSRRVNTNVPVRVVTLHKVLEGVDVAAVLDESRNDLVGGAHGSIHNEVTRKAARVVAKSIWRRVLLDVRPLGVDRSKVHGPAAISLATLFLQYILHMTHLAIGPLLMQPPPLPG